MKLELNLSPTAKPAQCLTPAVTPYGAGQKVSPFRLLTQQAMRPVRIPTPIIGARPAFRGTQLFRQTWRTTELATWQAERNFPAF